MTLFAYIRRHAKAFLFTIGVLTISGVAAMLRMPVSLFPDVTFPRLVILADNGEQPVERMMIEVTKPLEEAASSIPGVRTIRSITGRGSTEISVGLEWGRDVLQALQLLQGRVADIRNQLPPTASVRAEQMTVSVFPIEGYSLTSDRRSMVELRDIALYRIRPALMRVAGVARVVVEGGDTREFLVRVDPAALAARRLNVRAVSDAVARSNLVGSTGLVDNNHQLYLSLVSGLLAGVDDIGALVVGVDKGIPVRVRDVAQVVPSAAYKYIRTTARGREAVLITVMKQPSGSTVRIGSEIGAALAALRLPADVHVENWYDQGDFILDSISGTRDSIVAGIVLAALVLLFFLRSWRIGLVILLVVPATLACTFFCLNAVGLTINIMTLGGIAAAVGLIIDDSIVIVENMFSRYAAARRSRAAGAPLLFPEAAAGALRDLMPAVAGSTASTIVIHVPLAFLGGITGAFFASLSVTMVLAMSISFLFSITLAPLLASLFLRERDLVRESARDLHADSLSRGHIRLLAWLLRHRWAFILAGGALLLLAAWLYTRLGSEFMPEMDEGTFVLDYKSPPGTSLDETDRMLREIERRLNATPEVESYSRRTGSQLGFFLTEPNDGDFLVKLKKDRKRDIEKVMAELRGKIETALPALKIEFGQLMMDVIGDLTNNPAPIEVKLFGEEEEVLQNKAREAARLISALPGVVDVFDGIVISGPSFIIHVDQLRASTAGLAVSEVLGQVETMMRGTAGTAIRKGEKMIAVRTRFPDAYRTDVDRIAGLLLTNGAGTLVPLSSVATIEKTAGRAEIHREGLRGMIAVTARLSGRDLGGAMGEIGKKLKEGLFLPEGMRMEFGGVYQTQQESFKGLVLVALAAFLLVFIVLLFEFGEFAVPFAIFIVNILSLAGVALALYLTGATLNISSLVGVIMIIGIVAENAIFVMHEFRIRSAAGAGIDEALLLAVGHRTRPILMTTIAAVLALTPLALGYGAGAKLQQALAIAVIGGFSTSSLLLFFGLPVLYRILRGNAPRSVPPASDPSPALRG